MNDATTGCDINSRVLCHGGTAGGVVSGTKAVGFEAGVSGACQSVNKLKDKSNQAMKLTLLLLPHGDDILSRKDQKSRTALKGPDEDDPEPQGRNNTAVKNM
jgi:hypothetical protein